MKNEPVLVSITGFVVAGLALLVSFGVDFTTEQTAAITAFVGAVYGVAVLVRNAVKPVSKG